MTIKTIRILPLLLALLTGLGGCVHMESLPFLKQQEPAAPPPVLATVSTPDGAKLFCRAGKGSARFANGWYDFAETEFVLLNAQRVDVSLPQKKGGNVAVFQAVFDRDGQKIIFCPVVDGPPDQRVACASLYALEDDLKVGIKRTFDVPAAVRGGVISCALEPSGIRKI